MWIIIYKNYKVSKMATFVSVLGLLTRYGGFLCLFSGLFLPALICIAIGVAMHYWAESIAFNAWKKYARKTGVEDALRKGNVEMAEQIITGLDKKYAQYILSLLPEVPEHLQKLVNQSK